MVIYLSFINMDNEDSLFFFLRLSWMKIHGWMIANGLLNFFGSDKDLNFKMHHGALFLFGITESNLIGKLGFITVSYSHSYTLAGWCLSSECPSLGPFVCCFYLYGLVSLSSLYRPWFGFFQSRLSCFMKYHLCKKKISNLL